MDALVRFISHLLWHIVHAMKEDELIMKQKQHICGVIFNVNALDNQIFATNISFY